MWYDVASCATPYHTGRSSTSLVAGYVNILCRPPVMIPPQVALWPAYFCLIRRRIAVISIWQTEDVNIKQKGIHMEDTLTPGKTERTARSDKGTKRLRPAGKPADVGGKRENPVTGKPEMWCAHCNEFRELDFFDKINAPRSQRICIDCKERVTKSRMATLKEYSVADTPYGGKGTVDTQIWRYLKADLGIKKTGRGTRPGLKGRPIAKANHTRVINRIVKHLDQPLPKHYSAPIVQAILDPQAKVHHRTRLWLAQRSGALDERALRFCCIRLMVEFVDSVYVDRRDPIYLAFTNIFAGIGNIRKWHTIRSEETVRALRHRFSDIEARLLDKAPIRELQGTASELLPMLRLLLDTVSSGDLFYTYRSIAYHLAEHFTFVFSDREAGRKCVLEVICEALRSDIDSRQYEAALGKTIPHNPDHPAVGTIRQEYDHPSTTRFLVVFDVCIPVAQVRVIYNPDDRSEVGKQYRIQSAQLDAVGPGSFTHIPVDLLEESRISIPLLNEKLREWGMTTIPTAATRAVDRQLGMYSSTKMS